MQISAGTPRVERKIEGIAVQVPAPYTAGQVLTDATAAILNQTLGENISNNLRAKLKVGTTVGEGENAVMTPYTSETAQPLVDAYLESYEPGVKRGGSGEARVSDPVEKEARNIAREKAKELVISKGLKPKDVDMADIAGKIFDAYKDKLMAEGKKIVAARAKAAAAGNEFDLGGLDISAKPAPTEPAPAA
jgi:hypothetical protein